MRAHCPVLFPCRILENLTSERVDAQGISNIAEAAKQCLPRGHLAPQLERVLSMQSSSDLEAWEKLDDVIMGGKSGSFLQTAEAVEGFQGDFDPKGHYSFQGAVWRGDLVVEGGGFCGARTKVCFLLVHIPTAVICTPLL